MRRLQILLTLLPLACCASTAMRIPIGDVQRLGGLWHGWLITPRDYLAATLTSKSDGTFELRAPRTLVAGTITTAAGVLRFQASSGLGAAGWHGTITLYEGGGTRVLKTARDDPAFPGRVRPGLSGG